MGKFLPAATLLLACLATQAQGQPYPDACQRVCTPQQASRLGVLTTDIVVCDAANKNKCKVTVNVSVGDDGKCMSRLPYCVLCVVTGTESQGKPKFLPTIEWKIDGSGWYGFESNGVEIKNSNSSGKEHFKNPDRSFFRQKYTWDTERYASPPNEHSHEAYVYDYQNFRRCTPLDPFIVNVEN